MNSSAYQSPLPGSPRIPAVLPNFTCNFRFSLLNGNSDSYPNAVRTILRCQDRKRFQYWHARVALVEDSKGDEFGYRWLDRKYQGGHLR